jgi:choline-sulfatase
MRFQRAGFAFLVLLASASACRPGGGGTSGDTFPDAPVVLISIDTLRADHLPAYGYRQVETPAIDRLAKDSLLFENAYSAVPLTLPSHCSLLTGLAPAAHGVRDNVGYKLDPKKTPTIADLLRGRGYKTGAAVSAYVLRGRTGLAASFDDYDDGIEVLLNQSLGQIQRSGEASAAHAVAWIDAHIDAHSEAPFFYFLHLFEPHTPYTPPAPFAERYRDRPYDGEIAAADAIVGRFLDHLRQAGIYDRAVVVLLSDHGEGLGDHGEKEHGILLYREAIHVPLLVKLPGSRRGGGRVKEPAQLLDVVPTLTALLGLPTPANLPGRSLLGLAGAPEAAGRRLYAETFYPRLHFGWSELRSLIGARHHYIEGPDPELYDLAADPGEKQNVLARERRAFREMKAQLDAVEADFQGPGAVSGEDAAKLAALGYAAAPVRTGAGPLPDPKQAIPALAQVKRAYELGASGRHAEALALLAPLVERYPSMLDARFQLATNLTDLGRYEEALAQFDKAIALAPVAADGMLIEKARIYLKQGKLAEAEKHARSVAESLPAEAHEVLARVAAARGETALAESEARQAYAAESAPRADVVLLMAEVHLSKNEIPEALALLDPLHQKVATAGHPPVQRLEYLRGDALARQGRSPEAEAAFREEIQRFPANARAYQGLIFLLASQQRFNEIDPIIQAMTAASPTRDTYLLAAETVERLGDEQGARVWRQRAAGARM